MTEDLINHQPDNQSRGTLSGIAIVLFAALVSTAMYALFFTLAYKKNLPDDQFRFVGVFMQITAAIVSVGLTQFLSRKIQGDRLGFMQAFLGGWMSCLVLGMLISFFYSIFSRITGQDNLPQGAFAAILMLFSFLGLVISLLLSFIFKKESGT